MFKAIVRLYCTADRSAIVLEGDEAAAFLYAAPGDEVPASAAERFKLTRDMIEPIGAHAEAAAPIDDMSVQRPAGILRVAAIGGELVEVAGFVFSSDAREFADREIDEAQLLAILSEPRLNVEAALEGLTEGFVPFPGRDAVIPTLQAHVDYDIAHGRAHDRVGTPTDGFDGHPADAPPPPPPPPPPPRPAASKPAKPKAPKEKAVKPKPAETKEAAPAPNKEATPGENKGAGADPATPAEQAEG